MSIVVITGAAKTGKSLIANALRNDQINKRYGAVLVDETQDGDPIHLLEKIIDGAALKPGTAAADVPWKMCSMVIVVGDKAAMLDKFEELAPGFAKQLGPTYLVGTEAK